MKAFLTKLALAITLGIGLTLAALAQGSDRCVSTDQIIDLLASRYGEEQVASGVVGGGGGPSDLRPSRRQHLVSRCRPAGRSGLHDGVRHRLGNQTPNPCRIGDLTWHP